jgi:hypothetical protein
MQNDAKLTVRLPTDMLTALNKLAEDEGRSPANMARRLLMEGISARAATLLKRTT